MKVFKKMVGKITGRDLWKPSSHIFQKAEAKYGVRRSEWGFRNTQLVLCNVFFFQPSFVSDLKDVLKVLVMFLPLPIFWALFDQQVIQSTTSV